MLESVQVSKDGGTDSDGISHSEKNGPYLVLKWNTDAGSTITYIAIKDFANIYSVADGESGINITDYKINLNYDVVTKRDIFNPVSAYVAELQGLDKPYNKGIIANLSDDISTLYDIDVRRLKFDGHITHTDGVTTLSSLIFENRDLTTEDKIRNNSVFNVKFKDAELSDGTKPFTTVDGVMLGYGDMIIFHDHDDTKKEFIEFADAINHAEIIKAGVSRYEFFDNIQFTNNNFVWLRGNNNELCSHAISGNNEFLGSNFFTDNTTFFKDISVDNGISCGNVTILTNSIDISNKITIDDELINIEDSMKINKDRIEIAGKLSADANQISSTNPLAVGIVSSLYLQSSTGTIYRLTIDDSTFGTPMMNFDKIQ